MSLPDLTTLTEDELRDLMDLVAARLTQLQGEQRDTRQQLLDPETVRHQIEVLQGQIVAIEGVIATPNAQVRDNPAPHIMALARASRRIANNTIRLLRTSAGVLDSADLGEED